MASPQDPAAPTVVALMGSYHRDGTIAQLVERALAGAQAAGCRTETIVLIDQHVEFCLNCRECARQTGEARGQCVLHDDVGALLDRLALADAIVLAAPVNAGDVNALTRQLLERMLGFSQWPDEAPAPRPRREFERGERRPALLITSSAAPSLLTRLFASPLKTLRKIADVLGTRPVGTLVCGLSGKPGHGPGERDLERAERLGRRLAQRATAPSRAPVH